MDFIRALYLIYNSSQTDQIFELCDDQTELDGIRSCICIYKEGEFIGKLRWPKEGLPASVEEEVTKELENYYGN